MLFMATICFQCSTSSPDIGFIRDHFAKVLRQSGLKYESHQSEARCSYNGGYPCEHIEVSFLVRREIQKAEVAPGVSMVLQGWAGILAAEHVGIESFSYSYSIEY